MKYDKLHFQTRIDDFFNTSGDTWSVFNSGFVLDNGKSLALSEDLKKDAKHLYFKGILSLIQALSDCDKMLYSWSTIKLYYSVFFFMRASLASKKQGLYRADKNLYHLTTTPGQQLIKTDGRDHKAAVIHFQALKTTDPIQSAPLDGVNAYDWLMEKRETVNYKHRTFSEPDLDEIWIEIHEYVRKNRLAKIVNDILIDELFSHCFMEEWAVLAVPIKRMQETKKDLIASGIVELMDDEKKRLLQRNLKMDKDISKKIIE